MGIEPKRDTHLIQSHLLACLTQALNFAFWLPPVPRFDRRQAPTRFAKELTLPFLCPFLRAIYITCLEILKT